MNLKKKPQYQFGRREFIYSSSLAALASQVAGPFQSLSATPKNLTNLFDGKKVALFSPIFSGAKNLSSLVQAEHQLQNKKFTLFQDTMMRQRMGLLGTPLSTNEYNDSIRKDTEQILTELDLESPVLLLFQVDRSFKAANNELIPLLKSEGFEILINQPRNMEKILKLSASLCRGAEDKNPATSAPYSEQLTYNLKQLNIDAGRHERIKKFYSKYFGQIKADRRIFIDVDRINEKISQLPQRTRNNLWVEPLLIENQHIA